MPTCKDCIHYGACKKTREDIFRLIRLIIQNFDITYDEHDKAKFCEYFQDRSKFIELPCKVGQMVYRICPVPKGKGCESCPWGYGYCYDIGYQKDRPNTIREVKARDLEWVMKRKLYFGRVYFSTREEAEKALKERE